MRTELATS